MIGIIMLGILINFIAFFRREDHAIDIAANHLLRLMA